MYFSSLTHRPWEAHLAQEGSSSLHSERTCNRSRHLLLCQTAATHLKIVHLRIRNPPRIWGDLTHGMMPAPAMAGRRHTLSQLMLLKLNYTIHLWIPHILMMESPKQQGDFQTSYKASIIWHQDSNLNNGRDVSHSSLQYRPSYLNIKLQNSKSGVKWLS